MVNLQSEQRLDRVFHALADQTRREILRKISEREHSIGELAEPFRMSLAAVSKHIKVLEHAGLLERTKEGRVNHCKMNAEPLNQVTEVISYYQKFWSKQLDGLEAYFAAKETESNPTPKKQKKR